MCTCNHTLCEKNLIDASLVLAGPFPGTVLTPRPARYETHWQYTTASEASKQTGSQPEKPLHPSKQLHHQQRIKTLVDICGAFERWRQLKAQK